MVKYIKKVPMALLLMKQQPYKGQKKGHTFNKIKNTHPNCNYEI